MKKEILYILFCLITLIGFGQNKKYVALMKKNISFLDSAKNDVQFLASAMNFEKIAGTEKKDWLPNYYVAMAYVRVAFEKEGEEIDKWADKAEVFIDRADSLSKDNAEILVLKAMCSTSRIMVDPMSRGFMFGKEAYDYSQKAMTIDPNNPRPYANKGQGIFYTPESFGGGPAKARPYIEKALERYKTYKPQSELHPNWGEKMCKDLLKKCDE
ncbi:MAG TPA: hypothetical protein VN026_08810 [Bacteroidia bacterium]|jgi:hypothetical protein|nr:hypothetical protein [Bacteroidia bacterium]